jgi:hypothetical protein
MHVAEMLPISKVTPGSSQVVFPYESSSDDTSWVLWGFEQIPKSSHKDYFKVKLCQLKKIPKLI